MQMSQMKESSALIKLILMGFSGKGKSTALVPLAIPEIVKGFPGLKLRVLDYDGKFFEVAQQNLSARRDRRIASRNRLTPITQEQYDAALDNIDIEVLREKTKPNDQGGVSIIGQPQAWTNTQKALERWLRTADSQSVIALDSWTHMTQTALPAYCMALQNKSFNEFGNAPHGNDYMMPQKLSRNMLTLLADTKCHVIVCCHQEAQDIKKKTGEFDTKADGSKEAVEEVVHSEMVPVSIGSKGRIAIPSQFNHILVAHADIDGGRYICTQPEDGVTTKTPFFARAEKNYPLDVALPKYWMLGQ